MSTQNCDQLMEKQIIYTESAVPVEKSTRSVFTSQTGQVLVALGTLFKHVPPFNESIDNSTSETLISIGRKLKSTK
ncbi:MAG: hypothetical protein IH589_15660 [Anaerolineales bacterium]|nr:hypothetical protein [Anaerolineales bacterium]